VNLSNGKYNMIYNIDDKLRAYLEGNAFDKGLTITLAKGGGGRQSVFEALRQLLTGKSVIHVGSILKLPKYLTEGF